MTDLKCPYDDTIKNYIIPTKSWLEALNQLDTMQEISMNKKIILGRMIEKENVIVKVTNGKNKNLRDINMMIKGLPNMVYAYCVVFCNDYLSLILQNKYFCSAKDSKYKVTLEIIKYYNGGSLLGLKTISFEKFKLILCQLILAQINLFGKTGVTHCDVHLSNVLINKHSKEIDLTYSYLPEPQTIKSKYEFILSDYDKCVSFSPDNIPHDEVIDGNLIAINILEEADDLSQSTLFMNILRTINMLVGKLDDKIKEKIVKINNELLMKNEADMIKKESKYLINYIGKLNGENKLEAFKEYKSRVIKINFEYYKKLMELIGLP